MLDGSVSMNLFVEHHLVPIFISCLFLFRLDRFFDTRCSLKVIAPLKVEDSVLRMNEVFSDILFNVPLFFVIELIDDLFDLRLIRNWQCISVFRCLRARRSLIVCIEDIFVLLNKCVVV